MAGHHQQLLRHAAAQHAGAADTGHFGDGYPPAQTGSQTAGAHSTGTGADGKQIKVEACHYGSSNLRSDHIARIQRIVEYQFRRKFDTGRAEQARLSAT